MNDFNCYQDAARADSYAKLEFPGTYYLAYRDLPAIIAEHSGGNKALDFGCGAGRSTRFLQRLGFQPVGVDIAPEMIEKARTLDPGGDYRLIKNNIAGICKGGSFDLVLSVFTFDNIPTIEKKVELFKALGDMLNRTGTIVSLVSSPEIYFHEWASFTTKDFPENKSAKCGDTVKIIMTDVNDRRPVTDILWTDKGYRDVYQQAGLRVLAMHKPLAKTDEPFQWVNETRIAPWTVYVLKSSA
ncbi:MAG: methyltransferase domain-containing protein [Ignavibacteriales bacterium]|nr:methyltransferase domain-containing protein [Ignavibacteriales bacterium]MBI3788535.1 methyltransferase domain-containing protein [Ignavibacteriales bacterium]